MFPEFRRLSRTCSLGAAEGREAAVLKAMARSFTRYRARTVGRCTRFPSAAPAKASRAAPTALRRALPIVGEANGTTPDAGAAGKAERGPRIVVRGRTKRARG